VPKEFRGFWLAFESPARVLGDFARWLESELVVVDDASDGDPQAAYERRVLVARIVEVCGVAEAETVRERLRLALAEVGVDDIDSVPPPSSDRDSTRSEAAQTRYDDRGAPRTLGSDIFGLTVPRRFRGSSVRFKSPARVLADFGGWLESEVVVVENGPSGGEGRAAHERRVLVERVIEVRDIAKTEDVRERLRRALAEVGVEEIDAAHEVFDPTRHQAVDRVPPTSAELDGTVAEVERAGYNDHGEMLRKPEVVVYHKDAPA
jgi:hypothetical protein